MLDDDPTGTQCAADVPVLLSWDSDLLAREAAEADVLFLLTNSRAYPAGRARATVRSAAECAMSALPEPLVVLRGDSTLRAHVREEYEAVCEAAFAGRTPPLLLVPALPGAGRVTIDGIHLLDRGGDRTPLHETEYSRDPVFGYRSSRLLTWADERSYGLFPEEDGRELALGRLRGEGPDAVAKALLDLAAAGRPAVCAPDAETMEDLELVGEGVRRARGDGAEVVVRSAPAFAAVFAGVLAKNDASIPHANRSGLLIVCGSHVPTTRRQLEHLARRYPHAFVEVDAEALVSDRPDGEIRRATREAAARLGRERLAVVTPGRTGRPRAASLELGERIATSLATIAGAVDPRPDVVLAKGGITSAVTARVGLGAVRAHVVGPLQDGISLWDLALPERDTLPYVVFPGNVGADESLLDVTRSILAGGP